MTCRFVALCGSAALVMAFSGPARADEKGPPPALPTTPAPAVFDRPVSPDQPATQRRLQGETEQVARRLGTMIRFLAYHRLDQGEEQKLLSDAAKTLGGLTKNEMEAVIAHLEASIKAPDEGTSNAEAKKAYDEAPRRGQEPQGAAAASTTRSSRSTRRPSGSERGARDQNELRLEALSLGQQIRSGPTRGRGNVSSATEQADTQGDLSRDLEALFKQLDKLPPFLTAEQKERLAASKAAEKGKKIGDKQKMAETLLQQNNPARAARISRTPPKNCSPWPTPCGPSATSWRR